MEFRSSVEISSGKCSRKSFRGMGLLSLNAFSMNKYFVWMLPIVGFNLVDLVSKSPTAILRKGPAAANWFGLCPQAGRSSLVMIPCAFV